MNEDQVYEYCIQKFTKNLIEYGKSGLISNIAWGPIKTKLVNLSPQGAGRVLSKLLNTTPIPPWNITFTEFVFGLTALDKFGYKDSDYQFMYSVDNRLKINPYLDIK